MCAPESPCRPPEDANGLFPIEGEFVDGAITLVVGNGGDPPERVGIRLSSDDEVVFENELVPTYEDHARTGDEACGVCSTAGVHVEFGAPPA